MLLSDGCLRDALRHGGLTIEPFDERLVQPASIDLRLGGQFVHPFGDHEPVWGTYTLQPHQMVLGHTAEVIGLEPIYAARVEGKSTWGRKGLATHVTAGFIDPGFHGQITLELVNHSDRPLELTQGTLVAQLCVFALSSRSRVPYGADGLGSHYQGQTGATPAWQR